MAFKTVKTYNEEKFGGMFLLRNDGDYADVVFLYGGIDDVLVADTHYIKSSEYTGYVHCCGTGCPACSKGIRVQTKLFIPLYNINDQEIQFWDRTMRFEPQLTQDVFNNYPNPSEFVFRITRRGAAGDINTKYEIVAVGKNSHKTLAQILAENNTSLPEHYNTVCKEVTSSQLHNMLNSSASASAPTAEYQPTPRVSTSVANSDPVEVAEETDTEVKDGLLSDDPVDF